MRGDQKENDRQEQGRCQQRAVIAQISSGKGASHRARRKSKDDPTVHARAPQRETVAVARGGKQADGRLPQIIGTKSRRQFRAAALGKGIVLQSAEEGYGNVCIPVGRAGGDQGEGNKGCRFQCGDKTVRTAAAEKQGQEERDENARNVGQQRIQIVRSAGPFPVHKIQKQEYEVARLCVAKYAAVQQKGIGL